MSSTAMRSRAWSSFRSWRICGLDGDVERGRRLVGDQDVGLVGERHRDHHPLALAARELVRIGGEPRSRARGCATRRRSSSVRARAAVRPSRRCTRSTSPICCSTVCSGLSEVIGSWKIMPISGPRTCAGSARRAPISSSPAKRMLPVGWRGRGVGQELEDRECGHRLARPALADDRQGLAAVERRS